MSIQSEIDRISGNVAATYAAVAEKGGTLPEEQVSANLAAAVGSIPGPYLPGDGITITEAEGGKAINVALPTKALTQAEYDALTDEEKRNGTLYMTPGVSPDGGSAPVPTGAVISFLALAAPSGYLVCDGAEHSISLYPGLANYIQAQFGEANHFGGDGTATFAVPDMRNLFLRGYHGNAEEQLSGEIGKIQDATLHSYTSSTNARYFLKRNDSANGEKLNENADSYTKTGAFGFVDIQAANTPQIEYYTSRPVNMAVLYCIKT